MNAANRFALATLLSMPLLCNRPVADTLENDAKWLTVPGGALGSEPEQLTASGAHLYFTADDGIHGRELWRLGLDGQTELVADLAPGPEDGAPHTLQDVAGKLYFFSSIGFLWKTDGTPASTRRVAQPAFDPSSTAALGNKLYFAADDGRHGRELWVSGGTPESTHIVREGVPGSTSSLADAYSELVVFEDRLYFATADTHQGTGIQYVDGASGDVQPLYDASGEMVPAPTALALQGMVISDTLYFLGGGDSVLWEKRPGEPYATPVLDTLAATQAAVGQLGRAGDLPVIQRETPKAGKELWGARPGGAGLEMIADLYKGPASSSPYEPHPLGDFAVFIADHPEYGIELWRTDGTPEGTGLLRDLVPGVQSSDPYQLFSYEDYVLFSCENYTFGEELWRTDGTPDGTVLVKDINPDGDSEPYDMVDFHGKVYFSATHSHYGREIWVTDGTPEGTQLTTHVRPALQIVRSSYPRHLTLCGDTLYFSAEGDDGIRRLWSARGDEATPVAGFDSVLFDGYEITDVIDKDGNALIDTADANGRQVTWKLDPLGGKPEMHDGGSFPPVSDPSPEFPLSPTQMQTRFRSVPAAGQWAWIGDRCLFAAHTTANGTELWYVERGGNNPALFLDIIPGPASSSPGDLFSVGQRIFFRAEDVNKGTELWLSDGTPEGTRLVTDFNESPRGSMPEEFVVTKEGAVYFTARNRSGGYYLTVAKPPFYRAENHFLNEWRQSQMNPHHLVAAGDCVYFLSNHPLFGEELWVTTSHPTIDGKHRKLNVAMVQDIRRNTYYDELSRKWMVAGDMQFQN